MFGHLELVEKDYFGLQFIDIAPPTEGAPHGHVQVTSYAMVSTSSNECIFFLHIKTKQPHEL